MSMFPTNILVAIDGSDSSDPALRAAELSEKTGSEVNVIYVGKDVPAPAAYNEASSSDQEAAQKAQELLDEKARQVEEAGGRIAESYVVPGDDPADEIFELTKESDIGFVVVGSRGLGPLQDTVQNSVSSIVVREASCPVLVVHGDERS
jgi:nucleotide-binding universal stress UspA family protein